MEKPLLLVDRPVREMRWVLVGLVVMVASAGCADSRGNHETQLIEGVVVGIEAGDGFGEVESFTVKDGETQVVIHVDPQATYHFPLGHLNAHRAGGEPVRVEVETRDGKRVAVSIGDA